MCCVCVCVRTCVCVWGESTPGCSARRLLRLLPVTLDDCEWGDPYPRLFRLLSGVPRLLCAAGDCGEGGQGLHRSEGRRQQLCFPLGPLGLICSTRCMPSPPHTHLLPQTQRRRVAGHGHAFHPPPRERPDGQRRVQPFLGRF